MRRTHRAPPAPRQSAFRAWFTASRAIGILLLAIAGITSLGRFSLAAAALALAGIVLLLAPRLHAASVFAAFTASFARWPAILVSALYDSLFWLLLAVTGKSLGKMLLSIAQGVRGIDTTAQGLAAIEVVEANSATIRGVFTGIIGSSIAWLLLIFALYVLSRWLIWQSIADKRSPLLRWLGGNALWWLIWLIPAILFGFGLQPTYAGVGVGLLAIIYVHLGSLFHRTLIAEKPRKAIHAAFHLGLGRIHRFLAPYAFALLVYVVLYQPLRFLPLTGRSQLAAHIILTVLFLGWFRVFMNDIIGRVVVPERDAA